MLERDRSRALRGDSQISASKTASISSSGGTLDRAVEIIADDIRTRRALTHAPVLSYSGVREVFIEQYCRRAACRRNPTPRIRPVPQRPLISVTASSDSPRMIRVTERFARSVGNHRQSSSAMPKLGPPRSASGERPALAWRRFGRRNLRVRHEKGPRFRELAAVSWRYSCTTEWRRDTRRPSFPPQ
jgi:hypothetical protein